MCCWVVFPCDKGQGVGVGYWGVLLPSIPHTLLLRVGTDVVGR